MAEENVDVTEELTPEDDTQLDTAEPTTDQLIGDDLDALWEDNQEADDIPKDDVEEVSEEAETAEDGNVEEAKPKAVVLTRKEKEALKHAGMEEAVAGMEPSAMKTLAKKLATERSEKDKLASKAGELQKQLEAKEQAEEDSFDIESEEYEWMPEEAKEAFKAMKTQLKANQEALETLKNGSDHTVERFWDKLDAKQYSQYVEGDDVAELRSEIEGDADIAMGINPNLTRPEALNKCLELATGEDQFSAKVKREVEKRIRKKRGGPTPKHSGGNRIPSTGNETIGEFLDAEYDRLTAS